MGVWFMIFFDTETTGMGRKDQVIELAFVDDSGVVLFNSRLNPSVEIGKDAFKVHGIESGAYPTWRDIEIITGDEVLAGFNVGFDYRMLVQTALAFGKVPSWLGNAKLFCVMDYARKVLRLKKNPSLVGLCDRFGICIHSHSALDDALATRLVFNRINGVDE
jgi:DNA polymerase III subunit epsilon